MSFIDKTPRDNEIFIMQFAELDLQPGQKFAISKKDTNNFIKIKIHDPSKPLEKGYTVKLEKLVKKINQVITSLNSMNIGADYEIDLAAQYKINKLNKKIERINADVWRKILHILTLGFGFNKIEKIKNILENIPLQEQVKLDKSLEKDITPD